MAECNTRSDASGLIHGLAICSDFGMLPTSLNVVQLIGTALAPTNQNSSPASISFILITRCSKKRLRGVRVCSCQTHFPVYIDPILN